MVCLPSMRYLWNLNKDSQTIEEFAAVCSSACNCEGEAGSGTFIHILTRIMHGIETRQ